MRSGMWVTQASSGLQLNGPVELMWSSLSLPAAQVRFSLRLGFPREGRLECQIELIRSQDNHTIRGTRTGY